MADKHRSTLDTEIQSRREQLRKIQDENELFESLERDENMLADMESSLFSSKNSLYIIFFYMQHHHVKCWLGFFSQLPAFLKWFRYFFLMELVYDIDTCKTYSGQFKVDYWPNYTNLPWLFKWLDERWLLINLATIDNLNSSLNVN